MPQVFRDGYLIAASTDLYNGFHLDESIAQFDECDYDNGARFSESNPSKMCGQGCGECYLVSGPAGAQTFIVNEISDIGAVGLSAQGVNVNLGNGEGYQGARAPCRGGNGIQDAGECNLKVLNYQGPTAVSIKKIPCPTTGDMTLGLRGYGNTPLSGSNVELTLLNHRLGITGMWVRGRDSNDAIDNSAHPYRWIPRTWTNKFSFYPSNGLSGDVFGASPTKTFDIKLRPTTGPDLECSGIVWNPTAMSDVTYGTQTLGNCQFPDPGTSMTPCGLPSPPNPIVSSQFYSRNGYTDCTSLNSQNGGCSLKTEGNFLLEWRLWGTDQLSGFPNFGHTTNCHSNGRCIDFTTATGFAQVQIGWVQEIRFSVYSDITELRYWARCETGATCSGVAVAIQSPCVATASPSVTVGSTWTEYSVNMTFLAESCDAFQVIKWTFPSGTHLIVDEVAFFCNGLQCPNVASTGSGGLGSDDNTAAVLQQSSFLLLAIIVCLVML